MKWFVVLIVQMLSGCVLAVHDSSSENRSSAPAQFCTDLSPQHGLDIEQIMGLWYGNEVITHIGSEDGESIYDTCVVIHLADITNTTSISESLPREQVPEIRFGTSYGYPGDRTQQNAENERRSQWQQGHTTHQPRQKTSSTRYLRLIWDEKEHTLEYTLRFNKSRPGFWISSAPQSGSMVQLPYVQFTGTVQVLKAVNSQLVLTFCQSLPGGQVFSVVLSRQTMGMSVEENQSVRNLLKRRNLSTNSVRKVCYSGADSLTSFGMSIILLLTVLLTRI
ncbi:uncharacterized protein LOC129776601 [Toxorhynchites rutilus septentrionalis]|uniref:uncharacterized protein LOC129776601 n=1 Tax=Toxorhynchites rutilus septentrionalis TaxID=329112 RepID=UPI00247912A2|nr:uncharacterized protein LOC129776601 [Toxorhynchites rutilus septentrionalis]